MLNHLSSMTTDKLSYFKDTFGKVFILVCSRYLGLPVKQQKEANLATHESQMLCGG